MITAADARAWCMAQPGALAADCDDEVRAQMVGGVYCDGRVVLTAGAPARCVPTSVLAQKLALMKTPTRELAPEAHNPLVLAGVGVALVGLALWALSSMRANAR